MKPKFAGENRFYRWQAVALLSAVLLVAHATIARGQVLYGSLVGTVTDSSGAAVPGATVTITQVETNQTRDTVASDVGGYTFTNVAAGTYEVVATLEGFQKFVAHGIVVQANRAVRVDAKLSVGGLEESVTVTAQQLLQTETAAVQTQLTKQVIENIPVNGRSFQSLLVLSPGVAQPNYFQTGGINNPSRSMQISVNGAPNQNTVVRIDGVSATNQWIEGLQSYSPGMEAIETVNVVTSSFDADQGMAGGASVNVQIKSGTNRMQGLAFEYLTTAALRDRNYFLPDDQEKVKDDKNVFGGTIGGPIKRDKLFYFVSLESTVQRSVGGPYATQASGSATQFLSLPPNAIRGGDFSQTGTVIYDPLTGNPDGTGRTPFPGNVIPANRINPVARNLLALLPAPQYDGNANNYFATPKYNSDFHKIDTKVTWNASNKLNINGRFSYLPAHENASGLYPGVGGEFNPLALGTTLNSNVSSSSITATSILTSNFVVDGIFGFTRQHTYQEPPGPKTCWGEEVGIPGSCQPGQRDYVLPRIDINGWSAYGNGTRVNDNTGSVFDYLDPQYQWVANASWNKGSHNLKFGADVHRLEMNHYEVTSAFFNFSGGATALNGGAGPNLYNGFADFLLGMPNQRQSSLPTPLLDDSSSQDRPLTLRSWEYGLYVRDQWQLSRKLTLSAGLRWEYYPVSVRADRGMEVFDFATNQLRICGVGSNDSSCGVKVQKDLFTPRIGIAYRAKESLVFRAGFSRNPQNNNMGRGQLRNFPSEIAILATGANAFTPIGSISSGFPAFPSLDLSSGTVLLPAGAGVTTWDPSTTFVRGVITMFNVSAQLMLPHNLSAQIAYVGNRQDDIFRNVNLNYGQIGGGAASQPFNQPGLINGLRTTSAINVVQPLGRVKYDSLQANVTRRMSGGFQLTGSYTFAKATDWWAGNIAIPEYWGLNKGVQGGNTPHKLDVSAVYELPFGSGRRFLSDGGALAAIVGGWQVNGLFTAISGTPFTVTSNAASLNAPGSTTQLADQIKEPEILGGVGSTTPYFDVTAFAPVTQPRFGNAGFNSLRGPGVATLDASFFRTFAFSSDTRLQFRLEVFNLTNRANFANPAGLNVSNLQLNPDGSVRNLNGFGVIAGTNSVGREYAERYIRLGLRLNF